MLGQDGWTPLFNATLDGRLEVVKALLAVGANNEATALVSGPPAAGHLSTHMCPHAHLHTLQPY